MALLDKWTISAVHVGVGPVEVPTDDMLGFGPDSLCFYCGQQLSLPVIHWSGQDDIALYPSCARDLVDGLLGDYYEWRRRERERRRRESAERVKRMRAV